MTLDTSRQFYLNRSYAFATATAITEFVLIIPVLAVILALIFFLGRMNQDKYYSSNGVRYHSERTARNVDVSSGDVVSPDKYIPDYNQYSFSADSDEISSEVLELWVSKISSRSGTAGYLADMVILGRDYADRGDVASRLQGSYGDRFNLGSKFSGSLSVSSAAFVGDFDHEHCQLHTAVADLYFLAFENDLNNYYSSEGLIDMITQIYRQRW